MDPVSVIFVPGAIAAALALLSPVALLGHRFWRRRGFERNDERRCGRCRATFSVADDLYRASGVLVCARCASTLRRRISILIPGALATAATLGVSSGVALWLIESSGGFGLSWWLDTRWIPLLLPSVGTFGATILTVRAAKRANEVAAGSDRTTLLPRFHPFGPARLALRPLHHTMPDNR